MYLEVDASGNMNKSLYKHRLTYDKITSCSLKTNLMIISRV